MDNKQKIEELKDIIADRTKDIQHYNDFLKYWQRQYYIVNKENTKLREALVKCHNKNTELKGDIAKSGYKVIASGRVRFERFYDYDADLPIIGNIYPSELIDYDKYNKEEIEIIVRKK